MNKHASKLAEIENQLADSELYSAENKEKLTALLAQQVEVKKGLEEVEMDWLAAQEELETMLQAYGTAYESKSFQTHENTKNIAHNAARLCK